MPVHDWTRVDAGTFHDFHNSWITFLKNALNNGGLPPGYYALSDKHMGPVVPDVLTLQRPAPAAPGGNGTGRHSAGPPAGAVAVRAAATLRASGNRAHRSTSSSASRGSRARRTSSSSPPRARSVPSLTSSRPSGRTRAPCPSRAAPRAARIT